MKPLLVLLAVFVMALIGIKMVTHCYDLTLAARIGMAAMLLFTAMGHFAFTKGMAMMLPGFIPYKTGIVYLTGIIEILAAPGLLISSTQTITAWLLILFFVLIIPANINATIKHVDYQKGDNSGSGLAYLWFRVPLQVLFIAWVYIGAIAFYPCL
jgi:uncharacterized membrane protein